MPDHRDIRPSDGDELGRSSDEDIVDTQDDDQDIPEDDEFDDGFDEEEPDRSDR